MRCGLAFNYVDVVCVDKPLMLVAYVTADMSSDHAAKT